MPQTSFLVDTHQTPGIFAKTGNLTFQDVTSYITDFTLQFRIEDQPYDFVDNELRLEVFDYDGHFLSVAWLYSYHTITVQVRYPGRTFEFFMTFQRGNTKAGALGLNADGEGKLTLTTDLQTHKALASSALRDDLINRGNRTRDRFVEPLRIDQFIEGLVNPDVTVDYRSLPVLGDNDIAFVYISRQFWLDQDITNFAALNELAFLYDMTLNYDMWEQTITYTPRAQQAPQNTTALGGHILEKQPQEQTMWFNGAKWQLTPRQSPDQLIGEYREYDRSGRVVSNRYTFGDPPEPYTQFIQVIGGESGELYERTLAVVPYFQIFPELANTPSPYDTVGSPDRQYQFDVLDDQVTAFTRYLIPLRVVEYTMDRYLPNVGAYYTMPDGEYGFVNDVTYRYKANEVDVTLQVTA